MNRLVKKAQQGDADAFIELMEQQKMTLQRVAYGYFREEEDVADVMQDTILDAFEHIQSLKKPEYFRTWLVRILMNNCNRAVYYKGDRADAPHEGIHGQEQTAPRKRKTSRRNAGCIISGTGNNSKTYFIKGKI